MNSKKIVSVMVALSLGMSGFAIADEHGEHGRGGDRGGDRGGGRGYGERHDNGRHGGNGDYGRRGYERQDERWVGPDREYRRGDRLPPEYRHPQYVVDDWRGHHLSQPPRGYHWVQNGSDYILVAITTGVILELLLHSR